MKRSSSPGLPFTSFGTTNAHILDSEEAFTILVEVVLQRIKRLANLDFDQDYSDRRFLLEKRLVDLVRIFVKQEPHKKSKVEAGRWRLIWSISIVDQVVERFLWSMQTKREISLWEDLPSKPGMGASDEQIRSLAHQIARLNGSGGGLCDRDVVASDMELAEWMLFCGMVSCLIEYDYPLESDFWRLHHARHKLGCRPIVCLSNGRLYETLEPGLMLSGRFITSFLNSRVYAFASALRGEYGMCMGDDTIESNRTGMAEEEIHGFYIDLGLPTEIGLHDSVEGLEFCSLLFRTDGTEVTASPKRWMRTLYRLLSSAKLSDGVHRISSEAAEQFLFETRNMPQDWQDEIVPLIQKLSVPPSGGL